MKDVPGIIPKSPAAQNHNHVVLLHLGTLGQLLLVSDDWHVSHWYFCVTTLQNFSDWATTVAEVQNVEDMQGMAITDLVTALSVPSLMERFGLKTIDILKVWSLAWEAQMFTCIRINSTTRVGGLNPPSRCTLSLLCVRAPKLPSNFVSCHTESCWTTEGYRHHNRSGVEGMCLPGVWFSTLCSSNLTSVPGLRRAIYLAVGVFKPVLLESVTFI